MIDENNKPIQEEGIGIVNKRNEWYLVAATKVNPTIANKNVRPWRKWKCSSLTFLLVNSKQRSLKNLFDVSYLSKLTVFIWCVLLVETNSIL